MAGVRSTFRFDCAGLSGDEAFEAWRQIMARMFHIDRSRTVDGIPRGGASLLLLDDILANGSFFNAQRLTRDHRRIESTPDHLVVQLYLTGGFVGTIGGEVARIARGQIAVCDLRRPLDVEAMRSNTIGFSVPRHLLESIDLDCLPSRLDPKRERLLAARIARLHQQVAEPSNCRTEEITSGLVGALHYLFDLSSPSDILERRELDEDRKSVAEDVIATMLAVPGLKPGTIADRLAMSRATLFRLFEPTGGVMQRVWAMRLEAVKAALAQLAERRTLARLAADHGFKSTAHLSRSFRARYGVSPTDWRAQQVDHQRDDWQTGSIRVNAWWHALGR